MSLLVEIPSVLAQQTASGPQGLMSFLPFILIFAAMYFLMIAPQRKKQKEHTKMLDSLSHRRRHLR
jgi:preprotein translocase subunit YajC